MKRILPVILIFLLCGCASKPVAENSAYARLAGGESALCAVFNEPFAAGLEAETPTERWGEGEFDRAYIVPRLNGSRVELFRIEWDENGGSQVAPAPEFSVESSEDGCVIFGSIPRPEGFAVWLLKVAAPDGTEGTLKFSYNGDTGSPGVEFVK